MTRKGTAGRSPEKQIGAHDSAIDKAIKKTKDAFDGENESTDYEAVEGRGEQQAAKEYSEEVSDNRSNDNQRNE